MKKIVFLDLDGTLWTNERIRMSSLLAIAQAKRNGHKIFVNTGRTYCEGIVSLLPLQLDGYCFSAGSEIYIDDKTILFDPLSKEAVQSMVEYLSQLKIGIAIEGSTRTYIDEINRAHFLKRFKEEPNSDALQRFLILQDISMIHPDDYKQFMKLYICNPDRVPVSTIEKGIAPEAELTMFGLSQGEITNASHNKGTAIQTVKEYFQNQYMTVAVGDSENDLTMFKTADISIAMGNAKKTIQDKCDLVTTTIDNNGIYNAFKQLKLI